VTDWTTGTDRRRELREAFIAARGFWAPPFEAILDADPDFFAGVPECAVPSVGFLWGTGAARNDH
jgi:hypothetical protein